MAFFLSISPCTLLKQHRQAMPLHFRRNLRCPHTITQSVCLQGGWNRRFLLGTWLRSQSVGAQHRPQGQQKGVLCCVVCCVVTCSLPSIPRLACCLSVFPSSPCAFSAARPATAWIPGQPRLETERRMGCARGLAGSLVSVF